MKSIRKIVQYIALVLLMGSATFNETQDDVVNATKVHLRSGNSSGLAQYFNDIIDINIDGQRGQYGKAQAEFLLKEFFKKNPPSDYQQNHQGSTPNEGTVFTTGKLKSSTGTFKVYIVIKQFKGLYRIDTLDFSKE